MYRLIPRLVSLIALCACSKQASTETPLHAACDKAYRVVLTVPEDGALRLGAGRDAEPTIRMSPVHAGDEFVLTWCLETVVVGKALGPLLSKEEQAKVEAAVPGLAAREAELVHLRLDETEGPRKRRSSWTENIAPSGVPEGLARFLSNPSVERLAVSSKPALLFGAVWGKLPMSVAARAGGLELTQEGRKVPAAEWPYPVWQLTAALDPSGTMPR